MVHAVTYLNTYAEDIFVAKAVNSVRSSVLTGDRMMHFTFRGLYTFGRPGTYLND